jgi:hypothetical protein
MTMPDLAERGRVNGLMQDLAALTPPLLVCAVVVIAIVAFLRHEMRRGEAAPPADGDRSPASVTLDGDLDRAGHEGSDASRPAANGTERPQ